MTGPCLCGDPYCPRCGNPERAAAEEAEEKLLDELGDLDMAVCEVCSIDPEKCSNKAEIEKALAEAPRTGWLQDGDEKIKIRIPWEIISEVIQYAARDKDGWWWGFFTKPTRGIDSWIGRCWPLNVIKMPITALDWRKTLVERPGQLPAQVKENE